MNFFVRRDWDLPQRLHTPSEVYRQRSLHRREFLQMLGVAPLAAGAVSQLTGCSRPTDEEIEAAGAQFPKHSPAAAKENKAVRPAEPVPSAPLEGFPAEQNEQFTYGRPETIKREAAEHTNFREFSTRKDCWRYVRVFKPRPWTFTIDGLCAKPREWDIDDIAKHFAFEERAYRLRCVEAWAMCVPWTGFRLSELLRLAEPHPAARYVAFETFHRPNEAPYMRSHLEDNPWPYTEGLTVDEAMNELTILATGIFGEPLPKQHGAPIRLVVPWKYGFKSIKSIVRIRFTDTEPDTFWHELAPSEYGFVANVDPNEPHPRWSQRTERMLGTHEQYDTVMYNGYGDYVARLYKT